MLTEKEITTIIMKESCAGYVRPIGFWVAVARAIEAEVERRTIEECAKYFDCQADEHADRLGAVDPETGTLEFKHAPHEEHYNNLREFADAIRALKDE